MPLARCAQIWGFTCVSASFKWQIHKEKVDKLLAKIQPGGQEDILVCADLDCMVLLMHIKMLHSDTSFSHAEIYLYHRFLTRIRMVA